jgi:predicted dehydrogenase
MDAINIGIVGTRFMGRAHANAFIDLPQFFEVPYRPVLKAACGRDPQATQAYAQKFGWQETETDWKKLVEREDIDLVDICTSNVTHQPIALAAAKHGKHILCEKPLACNANEARAMYEAAESAGVKHMVAFNYRRVPALAFAKQLIEQGKIGQLYHFNAVYYQDWLVNPAFPYTWRHNVEESGSGALGDLSSHIVDLARFLVGEFEAVNGLQATFIKERQSPDGQQHPVTVDDATSFLARFQNGALGSFQTSRFCTGRKNFLRIEMFGSQGSLSFNLERLNELEIYSATDPGTELGFKTILVTEPAHPYMQAWWPRGHIIGWEHTFIHEAKDLLESIAQNKPATPNFYDGLRCQQVLDAAVESSRSGRWVAIPEK